LVLCWFLSDVWSAVQAGIARALYNLGNVYHAHGKQLSRVSGNHEPGKCSPGVAELLQKAVNYYKSVSSLPVTAAI